MPKKTILNGVESVSTSLMLVNLVQYRGTGGAFNNQNFVFIREHNPQLCKMNAS